MNVFVYGSLTYPLFLKKLLDRVPEIIPGEVMGYKKIEKAYKGKYPVAIEKKNYIIKGQLIFDLTRTELGILDEWEKTPDNYYKRIKTSVKISSGIKPAYIYVINNV